MLVRERRERLGHHPVQLAGIQQPFFEIKFPGPVLIGQQFALQPVGQPRCHPGQALQLPVQHPAQPIQLFGITQLCRRDNFIIFGGKDFVAALIQAGAVMAAGVAARHIAIGHPLHIHIAVHFSAVIAAHGLAVCIGLHGFTVIAASIILAQRGLGLIILAIFRALLLAIFSLILLIRGLLALSRLAHGIMQRADQFPR